MFELSGLKKKRNSERCILNCERPIIAKHEEVAKLPSFCSVLM